MVGNLVEHCISEKSKRFALKERMLKKLDKEKEFNDWAISVIRTQRTKE